MDDMRIVHRAQRMMVAEIPTRAIPESGDRRPLTTRQAATWEHLEEIVAWMVDAKLGDHDFAVDVHLRLSKETARKWLESHGGTLDYEEEEE